MTKLQYNHFRATLICCFAIGFTIAQAKALCPNVNITRYMWDEGQKLAGQKQLSGLLKVRKRKPGVNFSSFPPNPPKDKRWFLILGSTGAPGGF